PSALDKTIYYGEPTEVPLIPTLLGPRFDRSLGERHQTAHLHPFRQNISHHRPPFTLRIHLPKSDRPHDSSDADEQQQRMPPEEIQIPVLQFPPDLPAFRRMIFHQVFGAHDDHHRPAPVRNGVPEKRSQMRLWIGKTI